MAEGTKMVKCPVCGMEIEVGSEVAKLYGAVRSAPRATSKYEGVDYYFCSKACKKKFDENPKNFIK
jgi:YHS domain-containing protein